MADRDKIVFVCDDGMTIDAGWKGGIEVARLRMKVDGPSARWGSHANYSAQ